MIKKLLAVSVLLGLLLCATKCFAWSETVTFESGTLGEEASGGNGFEGCRPGATFSDTYVRSGTRSARLNFIEGDYGDESDTGHYAWGMGEGQDPIEGAEVWAEVYVYFGDAGDNISGVDWSWKAQNGTYGNPIKFFRFAKYEFDDTGAGWSSAFFEQDSGSTAQVRADNEFGIPNETFQDAPVVKIGSGEWHRVRYYKKFSGTYGWVRLWVGNDLKIDSEVHWDGDRSPTKTGSMVLFGYWNLQIPEDQYAWVDDITVTNVDPEWADAPPEAPSTSTSKVQFGSRVQFPTGGIKFPTN